MDKETKELVLANRLYVWSLIARGFAEEPDGMFLGALQNEHARAEVALIEDEWSSSLSSALEALADFARAPEARTVACDQFTRVFVGPGTLAASPWETMHTSGKRVLFHRDVLSVRDTYRQAGFLPERYRHVADDAIGLECDFMAKLAERAVMTQGKGEEVRCNDTLQRSCAFLSDHLQRWIGSLAEAIELHYGADNFYARLARFTEVWCRRDRRLLTILLSEADLEKGLEKEEPLL